MMAIAAAATATAASAVAVIILLFVVVIAAVFLAMRGAGERVIVVVMSASSVGSVGAVFGALDSGREKRSFPNGLDIGLQDDLDIVNGRSQIVGRVRVTKLRRARKSTSLRPVDEDEHLRISER